jgi:hypothetical protein
MLQSVRDQIVTAFVDALRADGGPQFNGANIPVFRARTNPLHRDDSVPGIVVTPVQENIAADSHESQLRKVELHIVCVVGDPDTDDETIDQKVEPLTSWVESRIAVDETFGHLALQSEATGIVWHIEAVDEDYIGAEMTVEIQYSTARNAPDTRS